MKLKLTDDDKGTLEYSQGNFVARFLPGEHVEIENEKFANYCLQQGFLQQANEEQAKEEPAEKPKGTKKN